jgi:hypothetical protein
MSAPRPKSVKDRTRLSLEQSYCGLYGGKSTGPRTPEGLEKSRRANKKHGHYSAEAKVERAGARAETLLLRSMLKESKEPA